MTTVTINQNHEHISITRSVIESLKQLSLKPLLFFLHVAIFFAGIFIVGASGAALAHVDILDRHFQKILEDNPEILSGLLCLILTGVVLIIVGACGICSAVIETDVMAVSFFIFLLAVLIVQVIGAGFAISKLPRVDASLEESMNFVKVQYVEVDAADSLKTERVKIAKYLDDIEGAYNNETERRYTLAWIKMQDSFSCCGYYGPDDWLKNKFVRAPAWAAYCTEDAIRDVATANSFVRRENKKAKEAQVKAYQIRMHELMTTPIHGQGCRNAVFRDMSIWVIVAFAVSAAVELICLVLCLYLIHKIAKKVNRTKRNEMNKEWRTSVEGYSVSDKF